MPRPTPLQVTITHNIGNAGDTAVLFARRLIALDWGRKGPNPDAYEHRRARQDVKLFHEVRRNGAAVIAAYKGATDKPTSCLGARRIRLGYWNTHKGGVEKSFSFNAEQVSAGVRPLTCPSC